MYLDNEDDYDGDNDDYGGGGNNVNNVIVISSEEEGENDDIHPLLNFILNYVPESPEHIIYSLQEYSNNLVRSILTPTLRPTRTSTSRSTQTSTATERLDRCCICLSDSMQDGIELHHNDHKIHIHCLVNLLAFLTLPIQSIRPT